MKTNNPILLFTFASILSGCGGGGGGDSSSPDMGSLQGLWTHDDYVELYTPNGEYWGFYDFNSSDSANSDIMELGVGKVTSVQGSQFSNTEKWYRPSGGVDSEVVTNGSVTAKISLTGVSTMAGWSSGTFTYAYITLFDQPAVPSNLVGAWKVGMATASISSGGGFSMTNSGCTITGSIVPDASGKNFYRLSGKFQKSSSCTNSDANINGVAFNITEEYYTRDTLMLGYEVVGRQNGQAYYMERT